MKFIYAVLLSLTLVATSQAAEMSNDQYLGLLDEVIEGHQTALDEGGDAYTYQRWGEPDVVKVQKFTGYQREIYERVLTVLKDGLTRYEAQNDKKGGIKSAQAYFKKTKFTEYNRKKTGNKILDANVKMRLLPLDLGGVTTPSGGRCYSLLVELEKATIK